MPTLHLTVHDLLQNKKFEDFKCIAGESGFDNRVYSCGMLDYELDWELSAKYSNVTYFENQLVLTSLLFAKENTFLILEAVKFLVSQGASCLAIKNVFNLPLDRQVIRYANANNFPIFVFGDKSIFFEEVIVEFHKLLDKFETARGLEPLIDKAIANSENYGIQRELVEEINLSFRSDIFVVHIFPKHDASENIRQTLVLDFNTLAENDVISQYRNGFLIFFTKEFFTSEQINEIIMEFSTNEDLKDYYIGTSQVHRSLDQFGHAIIESIEASLVHSIVNSGAYMSFEDINTYSLAFTLAESYVGKRFSNKLVKALKDWDLTNNTNLLETAIAFVMADGNVKKTAEYFGQHENTIRYRIKNITNIVGMEILKNLGYENLSIAIKIYLVEEAKKNYKKV